MRCVFFIVLCFGFTFLMAQNNIDNSLVVLNSHSDFEKLDSNFVYSEYNYLSDNDSIPKKKGKLKAKLDKFNEFMQWYLKYFPFPYASYSIETNLLFGLSKYNIFYIR